MKKYGQYSSKSKYSDFLTVFLIIVIVAIFALIGFLSYKAISRKTVDLSAHDAADRFEQQVKPEPEEEKEEEEEPEVEEEVPEGSLEDLIKPEEPKPENPNPAPSGDRKPAGNKQYLKGYEIKGTINIPKTNCKYPILERVTPKSLAAAPAILDIIGNANTGKVTDLNVPGTNALILGHNYRNNMFFSKNHLLKEGDSIIITDQYGTMVNYKIYKMYYTDPNDANFMARDVDPNTREITLQTCNDDSSQRLIIYAKDR